MRKRIVSISALLVAFTLGWTASSRQANVHAQTRPSPADLQVSAFAPIEWGGLRGVSDKYLVFEDKELTIRVVSIESGLSNFMTVKRLAVKK
ncbi:MAG: hypothetical protein ACE141_07495 [Bryobacteraceae bacterium]